MSDTTEIRDGIEWYDTQPGQQDCQCARCGSSAEWVECAHCEDGEVEMDWGDDVCPDPYYVRCSACRGNGGSWHCISTPKYCEANPIAGREHIASTALNAQAWRDVA